MPVAGNLYGYKSESYNINIGYAEAVSKDVRISSYAAHMAALSKLPRTEFLRRHFFRTFDLDADFIMRCAFEAMRDRRMLQRAEAVLTRQTEELRAWGVRTPSGDKENFFS